MAHSETHQASDSGGVERVSVDNRDVAAHLVPVSVRVGPQVGQLERMQGEKPVPCIAGQLQKLGRAIQHRLQDPAGSGPDRPPARRKIDKIGVLLGVVQGYGHWPPHPGKGANTVEWPRLLYFNLVTDHPPRRVAASVVVDFEREHFHAFIAWRALHEAILLLSASL
jgi:hypothetical protein